MNETTWFTLALWLALVILGWIMRKPPVVILGAIFGIWIGFGLYTDGAMIALILVLVNIYIAYEGLENWDR